MRASSPSRALGLLAAVAVAQAPLCPSLAHAATAASPAATAAPPQAASTGTSAASPGPSASPSTPPPRDPTPDPTGAPPPAPISTDAAQTGKPLQDAPRPDASNQPAIVAPANNVSPLSPTAGMGGRLVSATDPEARRAKAELEGTALDKNASADVPKRLHPQQRAAWWCMFGAFALGSAAGVFAGLAEVQEDKATRLAITLDSETGSALLYADTRAEYEDILRVGRRDAAVARGLLAGAGGFLVGGIALFIVHAVKSRKAASKAGKPPARVGLARGGLEVRF